MTADRPPDLPESRRAGDYRAARIGAGVGLTLALIALAFVDAFSESYNLDPFTIVAFLTAILTLFGLEARDFFWRRGV